MTEDADVKIDRNTVMPVGMMLAAAVVLLTGAWALFAKFSDLEATNKDQDHEISTLKARVNTNHIAYMAKLNDVKVQLNDLPAIKKSLAIIEYRMSINGPIPSLPPALPK